MQLPQKIEAKGIRVLTSKQLAEEYETTTNTIKVNFTRNRARFVDGKHYISLTGGELKAFKNQVAKSNLVDGRASHLYLWTEKGALLHAKSLNTDKAWQVYDYLVDFYFRNKDPKNEIVPTDMTTTVKEIPEMENPVAIFRVLLTLAEQRGLEIKSIDFRVVKSVLKNGLIGIKRNMPLEQMNFEIAFELSHAFIHCGCGDLINNPLSQEYNVRAEKAAEMIIKLLDITTAKA